MCPHFVQSRESSRDPAQTISPVPPSGSVQRAAGPPRTAAQVPAAGDTPVGLLNVSTAVLPLTHCDLLTPTVSGDSVNTYSPAHGLGYGSTHLL